MNKKLQIFVSSTYTDLIEERQAAVEAILDAGHIPAGMELFKAGNESQLETIYKWIDESDVYMLILGGRYGSIESKSGKSYTQLEYEYAISKNVPVFAVVLSESFLTDKIKSLGLINTIEQNTFDKYQNFKSIVMSKIIKKVNNCNDIKLAIHSTLNNSIDKNKLTGWVRGNYNINPVPSTFAGEDLESYESNIYLIDEMFATASNYKKQKEFEKSRMFFECCLILSPENEKCIQEYGGLYFDFRQYEKALHLWLKLINIHESCKNYYLCAIANHHLGNHAQAKEFNQKALEYPDDGYYDLVNMLMKK